LVLTQPGCTEATSCLPSSLLLKILVYILSAALDILYATESLFSQTSTEPILEDILIIGKVNAGKLEFKPTEINLLEFCQEIVSEIQNSVGINHQIIFQATADCPVGQMDEKLLRLILNNLLTNAVKYSSAGSQVHFLLDWQTISSPSPQPSRIVVLTIQDQGIGIPLADQKYLFSHFYRATNVGTVAGTGLGLAIVKQAVDLHGGEINFISEPELGTTFSVKLPLESY